MSRLWSNKALLDDIQDLQNQLKSLSEQITLLRKTDVSSNNKKKVIEQLSPLVRKQSELMGQIESLQNQLTSTKVIYTNNQLQEEQSRQSHKVETSKLETLTDQLSNIDKAILELKKPAAKSSESILLDNQELLKLLKKKLDLLNEKQKKEVGKLKTKNSTIKKMKTTTNLQKQKQATEIVELNKKFEEVRKKYVGLTMEVENEIHEIENKLGVSMPVIEEVNNSNLVKNFSRVRIEGELSKRDRKQKELILGEIKHSKLITSTIELLNEVKTLDKSDKNKYISVLKRIKQKFKEISRIENEMLIERVLKAKSEMGKERFRTRLVLPKNTKKLSTKKNNNNKNTHSKQIVPITTTTSILTLQNNKPLTVVLSDKSHTVDFIYNPETKKITIEGSKRSFETPSRLLPDHYYDEYIKLDIDRTLFKLGEKDTILEVINFFNDFINKHNVDTGSNLELITLDSLSNQDKRTELKSIWNALSLTHHPDKFNVRGNPTDEEITNNQIYFSTATQYKDTLNTYIEVITGKTKPTTRKTKNTSKTLL